MPRTKLDALNEPKIDWPIAALLQRKLILGLNWQHIADSAGMNCDTLRKMVSDKRSDEWPVYILRKVMKAVGLDYRIYLGMNTEDGD